MIITDEELREWYEEMSEQGKWTCMVIDEAHKIKNSESKTYEKLLTVKVHFRLLLTATPLVNEIEELWNLIKFLYSESLSGQLFHVKFPDKDPECVSALQNVCNFDVDELCNLSWF